MTTSTVFRFSLICYWVIGSIGSITMSNPFGGFGSDDNNSFETGNPLQQGVKKAAKVVSDQAAQQAKQTTQDIVAQLFGVDYSKGDQQDKNGQGQKQQSTQPQQSSAAQQVQQMQKQQSEFPGIQTEADQQKYQSLTQQLGEEKQKDQIKDNRKAQEEHRMHMQSYFDPNIGSLETQLKKLKQQEDQKKKQETEQEEQQKQEKKQIELQKKDKEQEEAIAVQRARTNAERKSAGAG